MTMTETLYGALSEGELREALDARFGVAPCSGWAVLFHDGRADRFTIRAAAAGVDVLGREAEERLLDRYRSNRFGPVADGYRFAPDGPAVRFAWPLEFRGERYGLFAVLGEGTVEESAARETAEALGAEMVKVEMAAAAESEATTARTKLAALNEAGELVRYVDLEVLLPKLMELSLRIMDAQVGAILLVRDGRVRAGVEWGLSEEAAMGLLVPGGGSFVRSVLEGGAPVLIDDTASSDRIDTSAIAASIHSILAVPLVSPTGVLGAVLVVNGEQSGLDRGQSEVLMTVANLAAVALDNALLYGRAIESERISAEVQLASRIQQSLLPEHPPEVRGARLDGWSIACNETGGDYYDFIDMGEGRTGIVVGDATGHGMGAALMMFIVRSILHALLTKSRDLVDILSTMNTMVERDTKDDRFMTFFFGVLDAGARRLVYASAGHDPAILYRPSTGRFLDLESTGVPLGIVDEFDYPAVEVGLEPGDVVVFGTDGVWETRNPEGEPYGIDRLRTLVVAAHREDVAAIGKQVRDDLTRFRGDGRQRDDITAVFLKVIDEAD